MTVAHMKTEPTLIAQLSGSSCRRVWQAEYSTLCYVYPSVRTIGHQQHFKMRRFSFGNCWKSKNSGINSGKWHTGISNPHKKFTRASHRDNIYLHWTLCHIVVLDYLLNIKLRWRYGISVLYHKMIAKNILFIWLYTIYLECI